MNKEIVLHHDKIVDILFNYVAREAYRFLETDYANTDKIVCNNLSSLLVPMEGLSFSKETFCPKGCKANHAHNFNKCKKVN